MVLSLSLIAVFAGLTLASVYTLTKEPIALSKQAKQQNAIREVLPAFKRLDEAEKVKVATGDSLEMYKAYGNNDTFLGAAVETVSHNGYSGDIKLMVGFDVKGNIINYSVLEQMETPGLGTKIVDWFRTETRNQSIIGKNPVKNNLTVSKDGGEIDAITAATISSRAFLEAVQNAYDAYAENSDMLKRDGESGATETNDNKNDSIQIKQE
ncbi:MAG: RnfABCDGE type electron transport complex subunit G [Bacteroidales bacterium]|nr:RnfABCDGE type electron transport complex subunit G [Bacteroidales bacterium]